jgi:DNA-binding transcriptional MerR regulator
VTAVPSDLVSTPEAAKALGVSPRTLQRYVKAGLVTPEITLPSGQYRWNVAKLRRQIGIAEEG